MPIRFRCGYCQKLLGIARRKAGTQTTCPHCAATITVPVPDVTEADLDEIGRLLTGAPPPTPPERPAAVSPGEQPLFEGDLDAVLGEGAAPRQRPPAKPKPTPTSGLDASTLANTGEQVAMSSKKVTVAVVAVVLLLAVAFVVGFLVANR